MLGAMNWGRGFFRLWVVAIPVWVVWVTIYADGANARLRVKHPGAVAVSTEEAIALMIAGPVIALVGYFAIRWIIRGFRVDLRDPAAAALERERPRPRRTGERTGR